MTTPPIATPEHTRPLVDTLYYDGRCPLCHKEIKLLKKLTGGKLGFTDIHTGEHAIARDLLLLNLHLQTADGSWVTGLDANVRAWSHTPVGWLFKWLRWRPFKPLADKIYRRWADKRFCQRYQCSVDQANK